MENYNGGYRLIYQFMRASASTLSISENTVKECIAKTATLLNIAGGDVIGNLTEYYTSDFLKPLIEVSTDVWEPISQNVYDCLADKGWIVEFEIGRGSETLALKINKDSIQAAALISFPIFNIKTNFNGPDMSGIEMARRLQATKSEKVSNLLVKIYDVIKCSSIYDNPKYKTQNDIYVVEKVQTTLDIYLQKFRETPYTTRFKLAYDILKKIYGINKELNELGYWHSDLLCTNIGVNIDSNGNVDLKLIDLNSLVEWDRKVSPDVRDIEIAYHDVLIILDMAEVRYKDSTPFPVVTAWKGKKLYLKHLA